MLDHMILTVSDIRRSLAFYDAALKPLPRGAGRMVLYSQPRREEREAVREWSGRTLR